MEQILNKLSEIEATANAIMQDAARQNSKNFFFRLFLNIFIQ